MEHKIQSWEGNDSKSKFFLRKHTEVEGSEYSDADVSPFLFVAQEKWQQDLLLRYGNAIFLLDATYKTTKYSLPLFFVCVKTNVDYMVVGHFVIQNEDASSIAEALEILRSWNPTWQPRNAMCDFSEAEINALESLFPGISVMICDFHREQAWERWTKKSQNGLSHDQREELLACLRGVAFANSEINLAKALQNLESCPSFSLPKVSEWLSKTWLPVIHRWCRFYRNNESDIVINTNNGLERQNKVLKYDFLTKFSDRSISGLLTIVKDHYLPSRYRKYVSKNLTLSKDYRYFKMLTFCCMSICLMTILLLTTPIY